MTILELLIKHTQTIIIGCPFGIGIPYLFWLWWSSTPEQSHSSGMFYFPDTLSEFAALAGLMMSVIPAAILFVVADLGIGLFHYCGASTTFSISFTRWPPPCNTVVSIVVMLLMLVCQAWPYGFVLTRTWVLWSTTRKKQAGASQ